MNKLPALNSNAVSKQMGCAALCCAVLCCAVENSGDLIIFVTQLLKTKSALIFRPQPT